MTDKKTIILSSIQNGNEKAVLNIDKNNEGVVGTVRLYNFLVAPEGILSLGFLSGGKVVKAALTEKSNDYYYFSANNTLPENEFSCALIAVKNGKATPMLMGSTDGKTQSLKEKLASGEDILADNNLTFDKTKKFLDEREIDFDDEEKQEIEKVITANLGSKCADCKYREAFFANSACTNVNCELANQQENFGNQNISLPSFYDEIKQQIDLLFEQYPEEAFLSEIIPNSKWVKVDFEDNGIYYVIGLIYEDELLKFICYGVPGSFADNPPKELTGVCQWLPLDPDRPEGLGYWIMCQDADSGENVDIKIS